MVASPKEEVSGKQADVWKIIWLGGNPAKMAHRTSASLVSWFSALFTACLLGGLDLVSQGKVLFLFTSKNLEQQLL